MRDELSDAMSQLLEAFRREGIDYPQSRLDDAVEDFSHLLRFVRVVREDLATAGNDTDD